MNKYQYKLSKASSQQDILLKELRRIERENERFREQKVLRLLNKAVEKKKIKKIPPPLVPLPYHLVPKRLITELGIKPPLQVAAQNDLGSLTKKEKALLLASGQNLVEVFERRIDPETNQPYDDRSHASRYLDEENPLLNQMHPGQYKGLQKNEDDLTKLLVTKDDQIQEVMNR